MSNSIKGQINFSPTPSLSVGSQITIEPQSTKSKIAEALLAILRGMSEFKYVAFDDVKITFSDFKDYELPAAQFYDVQETIVHQRSYAERTWTIALELINKPTADKVISQQSMWNLEYRVARAIWKDPTLGVPNVVNARYTGNTTDLHLVKPFYLLTMNFDVVYNEHLVSDC